MAGDEELDELTEDMPDGLARKKWTGKKIVLVAAPVLLLLIGGGVAFSMGLFGGGKEEQHADAEQVVSDEASEVIFYDVPELLVNLNTGDRKATYLKISVALELDRQSAAQALDEKLPRVVDNFQVYLRELRVEDLSGSAGLFRLKEELMRQVNQAIAPARIEDVLFKEMLVQ